MNTNLEQHDIRYIEQGDYLLPTLTLPDSQDERPIGVWGQRRRRYLKEHHRVLYYNLLTSCTLHEHLADIDEQAEKLFFSAGKTTCRKRRCYGKAEI